MKRRSVDRELVFHSHERNFHQLSVIVIMMKPWRDAATVILAARQQQKINQAVTSAVFQYDYKLLGLKRQKNASFMPGHHVFPGGTVDPADADLRWQNLYSRFGFDLTSFSSLLPRATTRPPIFKSRRNELPREVSLRISAIRETFEECGVLLCRQSRKKGIWSDWAESFEFEKKSWQERVHNEASEFYKMCEGLHCFPDVWSLHEWSNWLTPPFISGRRFDTIFFLACMPSEPDTQCEPSEVEELRWDLPRDLINPTATISLAPPQHYEIGRIAKFESIDNLLDFAVERSKIGSHLICAVKAKLSDGMVFLLPGDSMYPKDPNFSEAQDLDFTNMTIAEFRSTSECKNRLEQYDIEVKRVVSENIDSKDGHLNPLPLETVHVKSRVSKL
ncbi:nucleoside diphosphate-linked moiety X motif 19-like isoform X2 [Diachasma alloeum]|uniref:nucleoside diphosphate-linked moiety X motif 19-like isoform X2 n=1 Tax=Diachasma alloeum TaxID=454923 RepID=UPI0007383FD5|nr:nucleoside diphosphate-linked moiety X motif 19-like isoform X2 [Diachasma alloeum]